MPLTKVGKWAVIYGAVGVEVAALTGAYYVWHNMNISQGEEVAGQVQRNGTQKQ